MKVNSVSPWEGELVWVGAPRSGKTKKGSEWRSVDFALKYSDEQGYERRIAFNAFGADRVDKVTSTRLGATVRVAWKPDSREYDGRWFTKLEAYDVAVVSQEEEPKSTTLPPESPAYGQPQDGDQDLPFNQSPGARG